MNKDISEDIELVCIEERYKGTYYDFDDYIQFLNKISKDEKYKDYYMKSCIETGHGIERHKNINIAEILKRVIDTNKTISYFDETYLNNPEVFNEAISKTIFNETKAIANWITLNKRYASYEEYNYFKFNITMENKIGIGIDKSFNEYDLKELFIVLKRDKNSITNFSVKTFYPIKQEQDKINEKQHIVSDAIKNDNQNILTPIEKVYITLKQNKINCYYLPPASTFNEAIKISLKKENIKVLTKLYEKGLSSKCRITIEDNQEYNGNQHKIQELLNLNTDINTKLNGIKLYDKLIDAEKSLNNNLHTNEIKDPLFI